MSIITRWQRLHRGSVLRRAALKLLLFLLVLGLTLYPKVWLLPTVVSRVYHLDAVLDPEHPAVAEMAEHIRARAGLDVALEQVAPLVESATYQRVPYAFDWETWGVMEYVPTVAEVFEMGREDCDGRAVVAASLLRRLGYDAHLVADLKHMWVVAADPATPDVPPIQLMSPGSGSATIVVDEGGTRVDVSLASAGNLGRGLAFGIAVFPLVRELIIVVALFLALLHPRMPVWRGVLGGVLLVVALGLLRAAGPSGGLPASNPLVMWLGLLTALVGLVVVVIRTKGGRHGPTRS